MDSNTTLLPDFSALTQEELQHEFLNLFSKYQQLKQDHEENSQEIYNLKRSLQAASATEAYLSQELELVSSLQRTEISKIQQKYNQEIEELKQKYAECCSNNSSLEKSFEELKKENNGLKKQIHEVATNAQYNSFQIPPEIIEKELQLERENLELLAKIDNFQKQINQMLLAIAEREGQVETLKEHVHCLEENLQSKRCELEEKTNLLESTQEQMIELNAELAMLKQAPESENRKGNSLFAEVDDQRQEMKKLLTAQKKNYLYMKKIYNESQREIQRLKRENAAIHKELQICTSIFLTADKTYKDKLNERISQLIKQNEELERKLSWTQNKLIDLSNNKEINWLDSMLTFCKKETQELNAQLHSCRIQKGILENNLQSSQQELARWRFEALKSRCVIIDRETLLEENGISFKDFSNEHFNISEAKCITARPQIFTGKYFENKSTETSSQCKASPTKVQDKQKGSEKAVNENINNTVGSVELENISKPKDTPDEVSNIKVEVVRPNNQDFDIYHHITLSQNHELTEQLPQKFDIVSNTSDREDTTYLKSPLKCTENQLKKETSSVNNKLFDIYEDSTQSLPLVKCNEANGQNVDEKENENTMPCSSGMQKIEEGLFKLNCEVKNINKSIKSEPSEFDHNSKSILVKQRGIIDDREPKSVRFNVKMDELEGKTSVGTYSKQTRTKSNVLIKNLVVKSSSDKI